MPVSQFGHFAAARRTAYKTFLNKKRLIHLLQRSGVLANSRGNGGYAHWPTLELVDNGGQNLVVYFVQPILVNVQRLKGIARNGGIDSAVALDLRKIAHTAQQRIGYTRRTAARRLFQRPLRHR